MRSLFILLAFLWSHVVSAQVQLLDSASYIYPKGASTNPDFRFIDRYIAGKQIIWLGEDHHQVSEFNYLKSNLVAYLHDRFGFDILLMECPIDATYPAFNNRTDQSQNIIGANKGLIPIWRVMENKHLFDTLSAAAGITISGMDLSSGNIMSAPGAYRHSGIYRWLPGSGYLTEAQQTTLYRLDSIARDLNAQTDAIRTISYKNGKGEIQYTDTAAYREWERRCKT